MKLLEKDVEDMNTHTLNALAHELELVLSDPDSKLSDEAERAISYTVAALRAQPTESVTPVAWIRKNGFRFNADIEPQDDNEIPLYAAPVAAQAPTANADALAELVHAMFRSGNSVPVERITITRAQYDAAMQRTTGGEK